MKSVALVGGGKIGPVTQRMQGVYFETVRGLIPDKHEWLTPM